MNELAPKESGGEFPRIVLEYEPRMNTNGHELRDTLTKGETLTVEFKSNRKP